jgi:hypothetical protein
LGRFPSAGKFFCKLKVYRFSVQKRSASLPVFDHLCLNLELLLLLLQLMMMMMVVVRMILGI